MSQTRDFKFQHVTYEITFLSFPEGDVAVPEFILVEKSLGQVRQLARGSGSYGTLGDGDIFALHKRFGIEVRFHVLISCVVGVLHWRKRVSLRVEASGVALWMLTKSAQNVVLPRILSEPVSQCPTSMRRMRGCHGAVQMRRVDKRCLIYLCFFVTSALQL